MPFFSQLHLTCLAGSDLYQVEAPFKYLPSYNTKISNRNFILVPAGFQTDFASIPRLFWNIIPKDSKYIREASVVHDWLYTYTTLLTRKEADTILREAMIELGASHLLASLVYWSVRLFGGSHWKSENTFIPYQR